MPVNTHFVLFAQLVLLGDKRAGCRVISHDSSEGNTEPHGMIMINWHGDKPFSHDDLAGPMRSTRCVSSNLRV